MKCRTLLPVQWQVARSPLSGNGGVTRMDILFGPTPDAIRAISAAIVSISTNIPCSSEEWNEAESGLWHAMANVCACLEGNGHGKVRCHVSCCEGRTTVTLLNPEKERGSLLASRPPHEIVVYHDPDRSIWFIDDLKR